MRRAEEAGTDDCPVKIKLVAPPLYVLTTQTLDKVNFLCRSTAYLSCTLLFSAQSGSLHIFFLSVLQLSNLTCGSRVDVNLHLAHL